MKNYVSATDLARIDKRDKKTHLRYAKLGMIDPPIECVTSGRQGTALYYRRSVISKLALISSMKKLRKTNAEILEMLKEGKINND